VVFVAIYVILTISLNLQYGYAGIPNFGLVAFVALGGYVSGALTGRIAMIYYGINARGLDYIEDNTKIILMLNNYLSKDPLGGLLIFFTTIILSILAGALLAYIVSYPVIRLRADYLIITLIGIGELMRLIGVNYTPLVGGTLWVGVPNLFIWAKPYDTLLIVGIIILFTILIYIFTELLTSSPYGRTLKALREDDVTLRFMGKKIDSIKIQVLIIGSSLASIAGVLLAIYLGVVIASSYIRSDWTYWPWLMMLIGGRGNNKGAVVGASTIVVARQLVAIYKHDIEHFFPFSVVWLEQLLLGILLILFVIFRPQGILPEKPSKIRGVDLEKIYREIKERA